MIKTLTGSSTRPLLPSQKVNNIINIEGTYHEHKKTIFLGVALPLHAYPDGIHADKWLLTFFR